MQLLAFAFDQIPAAERSEAFRDRLRMVTDDSALPQNDRAKSPGRDAAFEIHVGAVCAAAKLLPVVWEEPDVTFWLSGVKYGLAAKRLKNARNLRRRIREAVDQINRSHLPGLIALDIGLAFNPENRRVRDVSDAQFLSQYEATFQTIWRRYNPHVQAIMARAKVLGIVVHDYHVRQRGDEWQLAGSTVRIAADARSVAQQREFHKVSTLYVYGLPNQSDASNRPLVVPPIRDGD
jgi:hypothetical protein